jgi:hypothetical protein
MRLINYTLSRYKIVLTPTWLHSLFSVTAFRSLRYGYRSVARSTAVAACSGESTIISGNKYM